MKNVMNINETAEYLNISVPTLRKLVRANDIVFFRLGKKIMFRRDQLNKWILEKERKESKNDIFGL